MEFCTCWRNHRHLRGAAWIRSNQWSLTKTCCGDDMSDIHGGSYKVNHLRRPYVRTEITSWDKDYPRNSGVEVTVMRDGIGFAGWYDSFIGIEGFRLTWEQFDEIRKQVEK